MNPSKFQKTILHPCQVFTAFYNRTRQNPVAIPKQLTYGIFFNSYCADHDVNTLERLARKHTNALPGGQTAALSILNNSLVACQNYHQQRDFPSIAATSSLSAYLKFGCCSIREAFHAVQHSLGSEHALLRQFYWRDFFTHIAFHYPYVFGHAFHRRFDAIRWQND